MCARWNRTFGRARECPRETSLVQRSTAGFGASAHRPKLSVQLSSSTRLNCIVEMSGPSTHRLTGCLCEQVSAQPTFAQRFLRKGIVMDTQGHTSAQARISHPFSESGERRAESGRQGQPVRYVTDGGAVRKLQLPDPARAPTPSEAAAVAVELNTGSGGRGTGLGSVLVTEGVVVSPLQDAGRTGLLCTIPSAAACFYAQDVLQ